MRGLELRPLPMSKYCLAVALLHPGIRANPWHRTRRRYFPAGTDRHRRPVPQRCRAATGSVVAALTAG